jgi:hypothetical protein
MSSMAYRSSPTSLTSPWAIYRYMDVCVCLFKCLCWFYDTAHRHLFQSFLVYTNVKWWKRNSNQIKTILDL